VRIFLFSSFPVFSALLDLLYFTESTAYPIIS